MTQTITSCADLVAIEDSTFINFIRAWERERRCALPLVDYLLEWGLESQADGALWAATEKEIMISCGKALSPPYPHKFEHLFSSADWRWRTINKIEANKGNSERCCALDLPFGKIFHTDTTSDAQFYYIIAQSCFGAMVALLDNWRLS